MVSLPYGEGAKDQGDQSMQLEFTGYYTIKRYLQREREKEEEAERGGETANSIGVQRVSSGFYLNMGHIIHAVHVVHVYM